MKIAPSLLSCDFAKMGEEIEKMDKCGADYMHLDVMDAHFVPNLTFGAPVIKAVRSYTEKPFDVHLMISEPLKYIDDFAKAGADIITFHAESDSDISKTIDKITENGIKPGLVIKPNTPASAVFPYLDKLFMVLVMTVEPGFGGQGFMADMLPKVQEIKAECAKRGLDVLIEADGGISTSTIKQAADAGVDVLPAQLFSKPKTAQKPLQSLKLLPKINYFIIFKNKTPSLSVLSDNDGVFSCYVCFVLGKL